MGERSRAVGERWRLRSVPGDLADRYRAEGWWDDDSLGAMVARGLGPRAGQAFNVRSAVHPWRGTIGDVDRAARSLAGSLQSKGVGPGDVVVIQLPNWAEAGIAFWAAAYLGAVVVPIVHFYGAKEVDYILRSTAPDVVVTADHFGHADYLDVYETLLAGSSASQWLVVGDTPDADLPRGATPFTSQLQGPPLAAPLAVDPDAPAIVAFTSGTTRDPKGVVHSHRTIGCEARQLDYFFPTGGPAQITGAPVGHFIGMLNAFVVPLLRDRPVNLIDVWDPGDVLSMMLEEGLAVGGGATYFLTSLLDHPDFTAEHLALMPFAGLGGSAVPVAVTQRATDLGIKAFRSYGSTEHPSITSSLIDDPEVKRLTTDGRPLPGVELRLDEQGQILSRGPDCFLGYTDEDLTASVFDPSGWYGPVTSASWTTTATSPSPTGSPTSSSGEARTSAPRRSRSSSSGWTAWPRCAWWRHPTNAWVSTRLRSCGRGPAVRLRRWTRCAPTSVPLVWPGRSGPSHSTRSPTSLGRRRARSKRWCSASSSGPDSSTTDHPRRPPAPTSRG